MCRSFIIATILGCVSPLFGQGSWTPFITNVNGNNPNSAVFLNEQYGFVSTSGGTFRTTDSGKTWVHINLAGSIGKNQFYFYTPSNIFFNGELESTDSGMTWRTLVQSSDGQLYIKNGIFFDASGRVSINHARSWRVIDSNFTGGETIIGNLDNDVGIWGGSGIGDDSTLYTTDLGKSWHYGSGGVESDYGYAIPFTHTFFRAGGDGVDAMERSNDGGATWDTVFGPLSYQYLSDGFGGDGCVVYAQTMDTAFYFNQPGVLQSVDQGATWNSIGGPIGRDDYPLCGVASRGAVCFAMSYMPGEPLWKYIDSSLLRPVLWDTKITRSFPDTLYLDECTSTSLKVNLDFSACDFIRLHDIHIDSLPAENYSISYRQGNILRAGHPDSASIVLTQIPGGTYHAQIHIGVSASDWSGSDTSLPLVLIVKANPAVLTIDKTDTINFGTKSFCDANTTEDIHISNLSCHTLKVTNVRLEMDSLSQYEFSASMSAPQFTLKEGVASGKITLKLRVQSPGEKHGNLIIYTSVGRDTIPVYANVLPAPKTLLIVCDSMHAPICGSTDGIIHLYNKSCRVMTLDSLSLPGEYKLLPVRLPVILFAGDSGILPVRYTPSFRGTSTGAFRSSLTFYMPYVNEKFDTTLGLSGFGAHGPSAYSLSSNQIIFDTLRLCENPAKQRIVLYSTGCDSLPLKSILINGDSAFSLSENGTRNIAVGDSLVMEVTLNPLSKGNKSALITITKGDNMRDTILINGVVKRAIRTLALTSPAILDFGAHLTCESSDTVITLFNPSCDTVQILGVNWDASGISGLGFGVSNSFPIFIPPGESRTLNAQTILDTIGSQSSNTASFEIISNADNSVAPITLMRSYIFPHPVHFWLDAGNMPLTTGNVWYLKLKANPADLTGINSIDFAVDYNTDLLEFLPDPSTVTSNDGGKTFSMSGAPITIDPDSSIALMEFTIYLTKDTTTTVRLKNISLNASDRQFTSCIAYPQAIDNGVTFNYLNTCSDPLVRGFMHGAPMQFSIRPNPAQDEIVVDVRSPQNQDATIEIFDALGEKIYSDKSYVSYGTFKTSIDTRSFSTGVYLLRVTSQTGTISQSFVKVK